MYVNDNINITAEHGECRQHFFFNINNVKK